MGSYFSTEQNQVMVEEMELPRYNINERILQRKFPELPLSLLEKINKAHGNLSTAEDVWLEAMYAFNQPLKANPEMMQNQLQAGLKISITKVLSKEFPRLPTPAIREITRSWGSYNSAYKAWKAANRYRDFQGGILWQLLEEFPELSPDLISNIAINYPEYYGAREQWLLFWQNQNSTPSAPPPPELDGKEKATQIIAYTLKQDIPEIYCELLESLEKCLFRLIQNPADNVFRFRDSTIFQHPTVIELLNILGFTISEKMLVNYSPDMDLLSHTKQIIAVSRVRAEEPGRQQTIDTRWSYVVVDDWLGKEVPRPLIRTPADVKWPKNIAASIGWLTNVYRETLRVPSLLWNPTLVALAAEHATAMGQGDVPYGHTGFRQRIERFPFDTTYNWFENVALCGAVEDVAQTSLNIWINNPDKEKNLVGDWVYMGVGAVETADSRWYIVQILVNAI